MPRLFKDRFTQWLETQGQKVEVYQPGGIFGCPPMGWQLHLRSSSIAYVVRQEQDHIGRALRGGGICGPAMEGWQPDEADPEKRSCLPPR